ncbi:DUF4136 domain-containing protein [Salinimicrobium oceani]|uniref:DUF4136 domain-containing protein n=1 Tax=Salinimicrobium oceani TaxID=2722702 RepID=A0ABX1CW81_9FLAO|nr:DUF4136 domain-containing protein [Salinimicrobium oceani]NJW51422.1 DUF4136 domain-containing protein [Salinimicrobium oceani]
MRSFKHFLSLSILAGLLVTSCGPKVDTNKKVARSMSSYSSYAFLPNQDTIQTSNYDNARVNEVVIDEIRTSMQEKNYRLDRNQPDLLVYYHLMMDEEMAVNANPVYTNYSYYRPGYYVGPYYRNYAYNNYFTIPRIVGSSVEQIPYKEGTLVIDLIDRRTNEIVWRGTAQDVIERNNLETELRSYVDAIFERLPK